MSPPPLTVIFTVVGVVVVSIGVAAYWAVIGDRRFDRAMAKIKERDRRVQRRTSLYTWGLIRRCLRARKPISDAAFGFIRVRRDYQVRLWRQGYSYNRDLELWEPE